VLNDRRKQSPDQHSAFVAVVPVRRNDALLFRYRVSDFVQMFC